MNEASFTLLELLLSVAIVGILVSLALPSYGKARIQAQKVACRVAIRSYAMDFSEKRGRLVIEIPQEANCHDCHKPRYDARDYTDSINP
jgi:prepilin-type N-terminal cleavage/methylation domain-containing protein